MSTDPTGLRGAATSPTSPVASPTEARDNPAPTAPRTQRTPGDDRPRGRTDDRTRNSRKPPPRRKRKVRKVHRVVRHLDVWSVAKMAAAFAACGYVVSMISGYLLWQAADRVGTLDGIEGFMEDSGSYESYDILGDVVFKVAAVSGLVLALLAVAMAALAAVLFNLISDVTGGVRMTVIDEDLIVAPARRPEAGTARRPEAGTARRPEAGTARRPEAEVARRPEAGPAGPER